MDRNAATLESARQHVSRLDGRGMMLENEPPSRDYGVCSLRHQTGVSPGLSVREVLWELGRQETRKILPRGSTSTGYLQRLFTTDRRHTVRMGSSSPSASLRLSGYCHPALHFGGLATKS